MRSLSYERDGRSIGCFERYRLESAFQPIFRRGERGLVLQGHEALLRPMLDGVSLPVHTFLNAVDRDQGFFLERLLRVLHVRNFCLLADGTQKLFLNINPEVFTDVLRSERCVDTFMQRLESHGIEPRRLVFEIIETMHDDKVILAQVVEQFRSHGVAIAIDDFGAQHSNFDRVFDLHPDLVKFDLQWLSRCRGDMRAVRFLTGMVELIKELDVEVSCEGIETEQELRIALDAGFDLFQGYFLGRPSPALVQGTIDYPHVDAHVRARVSV
ncbi:EAL domain-containing protein [Breoghania sp. L-A4]|uniref:EAL domain-containing protein n=1 Tax=Breoghania sp. L-A4 TaxID=2304600 RepID=UPI0013C33F2A|nr:EAL domain-containing protein [Breoghania sp. L-A4]